MEYLTRTIFITARNAAKRYIAIIMMERQHAMSVDIGLAWSNVRRTDMQELEKILEEIEEGTHTGLSGSI